MAGMIRGTLIAVTIASNILTAIAAGDDITGVASDSPRYYAQVTQSIDKGECEEYIVIKGKGIEDIYKGPCITAKLSFITNENVLVIGDPEKDPYALYSDKESSLKIVKGVECLRRIYKINMFNRYQIKEVVMTVSECETLRKKISDALKSNGDLQLLSVKPGSAKPVLSSKPKPTEPNPWTSNVDGFSNDGYLLETFKLAAQASYTGGVCSQSIIIKGFGISDRYVGPCDDIATAYALLKGTPILIVKNNRLTLFLDTPNILYVIKDESDCLKMTYSSTTWMTTTPIPEVLSSELCTVVINNVNKQFEKESADWQILKLEPVKQRPVYSQQRPVYGQQPPVYGQQRPAYGQQTPVYGEQTPVYSQQTPVYGQQRPGYGQQRPGYDQQETSYNWK